MTNFKPITLAHKGVELTILNIEYNKEYLCKKDCFYVESADKFECDLKRNTSLNFNKNKLIATLVLMNIKNFTDSGWSINTGDWELVDTDGFAYHCYEMCNYFYPPRLVRPDHWTVSPGTQVNFLLTFPELETGKDVAMLLCAKNSDIIKFFIKDLSYEAKMVFETKNKEFIINSIQTDWQSRNIQDSLDYIKNLIFSRLNNILTSREIKKLENDINNKRFEIEQKLKTIPKEYQDFFNPIFSNILVEYQNNLATKKEAENKNMEFEAKASNLLELTPEEFEQYIADIYSALGYAVKITPQSNDKGIDILMSKDNKKYAVQCKRHKGTIGSPDIQKFIGAMQYANISHGYFVTTGIFSLEAEKMANEYPIELIDKFKLGLLIKEILKQ